MKQPMGIINYTTEDNREKSDKVPDLYQLQIEGLKKGWRIYPQTLEPLSLIIEKSTTQTRYDAITGIEWLLLETWKLLLRYRLRLHNSI